ncbi:uncharacterized protein LOC120683797 [Panicum virgatum]|uniref:PHD-type zinc finger plants domain-containing protein n=1 Tax=Panicum virgatum TaxID=38727 RepID=A0A8T0QC73_PANVG|nr:uncharacterized protein LOC120683797 [Panicum virgatum]KAG2567864.1 hypothetical protein PVAP13_7NG273848 [Panicum virgatum]
MAGAGAAATVCSMCGDVGFPEKLFRCARCRHRFQHSYCTSYYGDGAPASAGSGTCDWCLSDVAAGKARWSSPSPSSAAGKQHAAGSSQESSSTTSSGGGGDHQHQQAEAGRRATTTTRVAGRRYKLLKDVLC